MNIADSINSRRSTDSDDISVVVNRYKQYKSPADASALYRHLNSTINSAISSYAGGSKDFRVAAYRLSFDAIDTFDPSRGVDVKTHVFNNLKRLNRIYSDRTNIVHVPEGVAKDYNIVSKAIVNFNDEHNRDPNEDELADITKLSKKRINNILSRGSTISGSVSVTDTGADKVSSSGISDDTYIEYLYSSCDPIDKKIIELTSGKGGSRIYQNSEVARRLNITPAAVILRMSKLREKMAELRGLL